MKPYIEDRNGTRYEFNSLSRKQKIAIQNDVKELGNTDNELEKIGDLIFKLIGFNYPSMTRDEFEDMLDYNEEEYGFSNLYEMLGYIIEDVFTQVGSGNTGKVNPYLQAKREEKEQA